jgi:hypothetical protein
MKLAFKSFALACVTVVALVACGGGGSDNPAGGQPLLVDAEGNSTFDSTVLGTTIAALPVETLSAAESASLIFMREEEKLAQDVYTQLGTVWGSQSRVFGNIARSEATHTEAIRQLLLRYTLTDPAATLAAGRLRKTPPCRGCTPSWWPPARRSLVEALKVGAAIEEIDMSRPQQGAARHRQPGHRAGLPESAQRFAQPPARLCQCAGRTRRDLRAAVHGNGRLPGHHQHADGALARPACRQMFVIWIASTHELIGAGACSR